MKELTQHIKQNIQTATVREYKKHTLVSTIHPHKGHTCFELNKQTGSIQPAAIQEINCTITGGIIKKVIIKENCLYVSALNIENAQKKFFKHLRSY